MPLPKPTSLISLDDTNWMKGLAIIAVVWVHFTSALPFAFVWGADHRLFFVFLDQLSRLCVPVFIFLSGYGLSFSTQRHPLTYLEFVKKRVLKLLPLYLIWSLISVALFWLVPQWHASSAPLVMQLLLGQADYQLYFVPLILVLYLLFPLIFKLVNRFGIVAVIVAIGVQLITFRWFNTGSFTFLHLPYLQVDQFQYLFPLSWIAYFVMGMWASSLKRIPVSVPFWRVGWLVAWILIGASATAAVTNGLDPLLALKFTRYGVLGYATFAIGGLVTFMPSRRKVTTLLSRLISLFGRYSYLIFLAHTWVIRIFFGLAQNSVPSSMLLVAAVIWGVTLAASIFLLNKNLA